MAEKKKILIHSIAFSPDGVSTAYLYNDIAIAFKNRGYEVVVLTTTPNYNILEQELKKQPLTKKIFGLYFVSDFKGIKVVHVPQKKFKSTLLRLIGFFYWHIFSFILGMKERNISVILSPSPPLTIGLVNLAIGKFKRAHVIYNVQEIYPDFLVEQGILKSKFIISFLKKLERFIYNKSNAVTTIDRIFYSTIISRFENQNKLQIIPNFVDTDIYKPISKDKIVLNNNYFRNNESLKVMYAGNIGHAQDWEPLIEIASYLKDEAIEFYVIGEGVLKDYLIKQVQLNNLKNVHILPYQPRESMPHLLAFSDLQFIFMSKKMEGHGFPSKVYTIMASAKPLLVSSGEQTPIVNFLLPHKCAKLVTTNDQNKKIAEMCDFLKNSSREKLLKMGQNGYEVVINNYTKDKVTQKYVDLVNKLLVE